MLGRTLALLFALCATVLLLDQTSKYWAVGALTRAYEVEGAEGHQEKLRAFWVMENLEQLRKSPAVVIEGFWRYRYLENPGAAWGMLGSLDPSLRLPFFRMAPLFAVAILFGLYLRAQRQRLLQVGLALIIGGALGNLIDRWIRGYVIDFIDWHWGDSHWPTFNVADVAISVGLVFVALDAIWGVRMRRRALQREAEAAVTIDLEDTDPSGAAIVSPPHPRSE